jgi:hypothetical protein
VGNIHLVVVRIAVARIVVVVGHRIEVVAVVHTVMAWRVLAIRGKLYSLASKA